MIIIIMLPKVTWYKEFSNLAVKAETPKSLCLHLNSAKATENLFRKFGIFCKDQFFKRIRFRLLCTFAPWVFFLVLLFILLIFCDMRS